MAYHADHKIKTPTTIWKNLDLLQYNVTPYTNDDLFGEGSVHDLAKLIKPLIPIPATKEHTVTDWKGIFEKVFKLDTQIAKSTNGKTLRNLAVRMAVTNPRNLFESAIWNGKILVLRHDTVIWRAAYELFGAPWNKEHVSPGRKRDAPETSPGEENETESAETGEPTVGKEDTTGTNTHEAGNTTNNTEEVNRRTGEAMEGTTNDDETLRDIEPPRRLFLSKPLYTKNKRTKFNLINPEHVRKYTTYYKVKLPRITKESILEANNQMVEHFHTVVRRIFQLDASAIILQWNEYDNIPPLKRDSKLPQTRELIEFYVDRMFIKCGYEPWFRMRITHNNRTEHMCDDKTWFRRQGMWFNEDDIQVKKHIAAGWFLGSHTAMILKDLAAAIRQHPSMKDIPFALKQQNIRLAAKGQIPKENQVLAAHIITDYYRVAEVRSAMKAIYETPGELGYPLGIVLRFVPNVADPRYKGSQRTRDNCKVLRSKQKAFLGNTALGQSRAIQFIDYAIKHVGTLRNIIMNLEAKNSTDEKPVNLFVSVEEQLHGQEVDFIFRKEHEEQATSTIAALPLILEAYYGAHCGNWLTEHAASETLGWSFDKETGNIKSAEDEYTGGLVKEWQDEVTYEEKKKEGIPVILGNTEFNNQYDDNGTVLTMDSELSGWSSSSNEAPNFGRMMRKMKRMMTGDTMTEEQKKAMKDLLDGKETEDEEEKDEPTDVADGGASK